MLVLQSVSDVKKLHGMKDFTCSSYACIFVLSELIIRLVDWCHYL